MKKKLIIALIVALSAQGIETVYAQEIADTVENKLEVQEVNYSILNVRTEGKGTLEINGQTLTGGDVSVKTGESVRVKVNSAEGYKVDKVEVNGVVLTKDNAPSAVESLANGYFDYTFWGDQANKVKVTFAKVETNQTVLNVSTEGKGTLEINGETLTGGDVLIKTGEEVKINVNPAEGYKVDKVEVNGIVLTKDNAASAVESLANGYFNYIFWGDQANKVKVTFAKVESSDNITEDQKPENNQKPEENQKPENNQKPEDNQKPNEEQKPGNDQIKEELPQTGSNVNSASMGILGLTSLLGGLFIKKNR